MDKYLELFINYMPKLATALATLVLGWIIINLVLRLLKASMSKTQVDPTLKPFLGSIASIGLKTALLISVASMLGIQTTSFIAILGAAGLAVGMALQGSLGNFAGGVLILIFKPFRVGDVIAAQGEIGKVAEISLFTTKIISPDNQVTYIPNGPLSSGNIKNITHEEIRRVDFVFGISYNDNIDLAKETISKTLLQHPKVLTEKEIKIFVSALADSSVNIAARVWSKTEDYWDVMGWGLENVKKALDQAQITIPFPQRDVHLHQIEK